MSSIPRSRAASGAKRVFDVLASLVLIACRSPIMLAVAIAVKFSSPGPVFYSQERIGSRPSRSRC